ncbi:MAG: outer membrane beta-barrel protein [Ignavibacteria bacterium]|nr:outer membrane beta-barrel protein [Ignavibacteria bacterium]
MGAEGIISINNYFASLALATYYEPFYQSGIKASYTFSDQVYGSLYLLNGYNVFADNNKNLSGGMQFGVKPQNNLEIIYNNISGNEQPAGSQGKTRVYNNLVVKYSPAKKIDILLGADFCVQQKSDLSDSLNTANMYSGLLSFRYKFTPKFSAMLRAETYQDENGIMSGTYINTDTVMTGLQSSGISLGIEHKPITNTYIRIETRYLKNPDDLKIFNVVKGPRDFRWEYILRSGVTF